MAYPTFCALVNKSYNLPCFSTVSSEAPVIIVANSASSTSIELKWTEVTQLNGATLLGYGILYKRKNEKFRGEIAKSVAPTLREAKLENLEKFTEYTIRVYAFTRHGNGVSSQPVLLRTQEDGMLPHFCRSFAIIVSHVCVTSKAHVCKLSITCLWPDIYLSLTCLLYLACLWCNCCIFFHMSVTWLWHDFHAPFSWLSGVPHVVCSVPDNFQSHRVTEDIGLTNFFLLKNSVSRVREPTKTRQPALMWNTEFA